MKQLLYIDLFCGAGGTSTGVNSARLSGESCAEVIACVNHDAKAIASHAANHPNAMHFTEDIRTLELSPLMAHLEECRSKNSEALIVLWASLECTNFSKAKGGQPRDADSRTLAEHLFRYIETINPDYIQIENVEEFMSWGSLDENGRPLSKDRGRSYIRWVNKVKRYGYDYEYRLMNAADYGAYTSRKRFFGIFAKYGLPIVFPEPTHSKTGESGLFGEIKKWKPVREVLDLEDEGNSIFNRKNLCQKRPLNESTPDLSNLSPRTAMRSSQSSSAVPLLTRIFPLTVLLVQSLASTITHLCRSIMVTASIHLLILLPQPSLQKTRCPLCKCISLICSMAMVGRLQ